MPFANRKSIFFDPEDIRDLVFKGYIIVYKIDKNKKVIDVFGFTKYENDPFKEELLSVTNELRNNPCPFQN